MWWNGVSMSDYKYLFEPVDLAGHKLKSRICVPPLVVYSWSDESGYVTDKHVRHYYELAHGGAGLVRQEATCVSETGRITLDQLGIWNDGQKAGLRRIKDVLRDAGMPAIIQLSHAGYMAKRPEDRVGPVDCGFSQNWIDEASKCRYLCDRPQLKDALVRYPDAVSRSRR